MTWQPTTVTLYTGEQVPSDSEAWRLECEVRKILSMPFEQRNSFWLVVTKIRLLSGMEELKKRCFEMEPYFVLGLPDKAARNAYAEQVERRFGWKARESLQEKVRAIWRARQATEV
jgi:hypothetical protein